MVDAGRRGSMAFARVARRRAGRAPRDPAVDSGRHQGWIRSLNSARSPATRRAGARWAPCSRWPRPARWRASSWPRAAAVAAAAPAPRPAAARAAAPARPPPAPIAAQLTVPTPVGYDADRLAAFNRLNEIRLSAGLGMLAQNTEMDQAAQAHAAWMVANDSFTHDEVAGTPGFTGANWASGIEAFGYVPVEGAEVMVRARASRPGSTSSSIRPTTERRFSRSNRWMSASGGPSRAARTLRRRWSST